MSGAAHVNEPLFGNPVAMVAHGPVLFDMAYSKVILSGFVPPLAFHSMLCVVQTSHFSPCEGDNNWIDNCVRFEGVGEEVGVGVLVGVWEGVGGGAEGAGVEAGGGVGVGGGGGVPVGCPTVIKG